MSLTVGETTIRVAHGDGDAHDLLIKAVAEARRLDPADLRVSHRCHHCGSAAHGVPTLTLHGETLPLAVSLSRADGVVLVAFGRAAALGVDIEAAEAAADPALDRVLRHRIEAPYPDAAARTAAWVRKEAALKAWGCGLHVEPSSVQDLGGAAVAPGRPPVTLTDLPVEGYQAALAVIAGPATSC
ncbi:4'-phosphopantetheinyl transferase family protein [Tessaracoccus sp. Y36]